MDIQRALNIVRSNTEHTSNRQSLYLAACKYLVQHRDTLPYRVFISLPGGLNGNNNPEWNEVKAGSEEHCTCGNERVINPGNIRSEFRAANTDSIVISSGTPVYIRPIGGDNASAYIMLQIKHAVFTFLQDPFAPLLLSLDLLSTKGYDLKKLAEIISSQPEPPVMFTAVEGSKVPIFAINAVDAAAQTVTITLDEAVEAFDPDKETDKHTC